MEELKGLTERDAEVCAKYKANVAGDATELWFESPEMAGMPASFLKHRVDGSSGKVKVTLSYPDIIPVMGSCEVESTRKAVVEARERAYGENLELMAEGVALRKRMAELLGYPSWAHFVIETRMAGTPEAVEEFLGKLKELARKGSEKDIEDLRAAKKEHKAKLGELVDGEEVVIEAWDTSFYSNYILKRDYGVDTEVVREFFPLDHVVETTLQIYQELLGLVFVELPSGSFSRWHKDVRLFLVNDAASGTRTGHFYLDLHPRQGKYSHAAIFHLLKRHRDQTAVDAMMCNLPAPSADGTPALLRHGDVVTFFHEFGHIMHGLCAEGDGNATRFAKCPRDFVEAPSQMLENWCWQPQVLRRLSKHYKSGEPLPDTLREALVAAKNVHEAMGMMRQLYLATLDLTIHSAAPPTSGTGLQELVDRLRPEITGIRNPKDANMLRSFGHLMNQYSAAYYGYLWAEVISADMFATRFEADCMSKEAGMDYRKMVLAPGGTGKIMDHLKAFLGGRAPTQEPFLRSRAII
mmetsp:Transcript_5301/g.12710  ORF Transcript_5301/g.12710 Transcript_5301/m.12710 type:complete len:523 (+) Transcript_5301:1-1569(+)